MESGSIGISTNGILVLDVQGVVTVDSEENAPQPSPEPPQHLSNMYQQGEIKVDFHNNTIEITSESVVVNGLVNQQ